MLRAAALRGLEVYGKTFMRKYRKAAGEARDPRTGKFAIDGGGTRAEWETREAYSTG